MGIVQTPEVALQVKLKSVPEVLTQAWQIALVPVQAGDEWLAAVKGQIDALTCRRDRVDPVHRRIEYIRWRDWPPIRTKAADATGLAGQRGDDHQMA